MKLHGEQHPRTLTAANNYATSLLDLQRYAEAKLLLRKIVPVTRRVLGESHECTLKMRCLYAVALFPDPAATLDDLREAVTALEDTARTARRVLGISHPLLQMMEGKLLIAQAMLRARETSSSA